MKCITTGDETICDRCTRKSVKCIFQDHRRGRKPGTRCVPSEATAIYKLTIERITSKRKAQAPTATATSSQPVQQRQVEERSGQTQAIQRSPDWSNGSLQPAGLFNRAATRGSFSLGSILNASESTTSELQQEESWIPADDPVQLGLLNSSIASSLFEK